MCKRLRLGFGKVGSSTSTCCALAGLVFCFLPWRRSKPCAASCYQLLQLLCLGCLQGCGNNKPCFLKVWKTIHTIHCEFGLLLIIWLIWKSNWDQVFTWCIYTIHLRILHVLLHLRILSSMYGIAVSYLVLLLPIYYERKDGLVCYYAYTVIMFH